MEKKIERFLKLPEVMKATGLSRGSIYDREDFPKPVKLGDRASGWVESEIIDWQQARISERDKMKEPK